MRAPFVLSILALASLIPLACASNAPHPPPPPKCPAIASAPVTVAPAPTLATPYDTPDLVCFLELPNKHVQTPGCLVGLPIDDVIAARLAALPNHDRWEIHLLAANDDDMKTVARIPWARSLVLEAPKLSNLDALALLPSLESVSIEKGSVGSLSSLGAHAALRSIEIIDVDTAATSLNGVVPTALVGLHIDGLQQLSDISALSALTVLKIVDLERLPALKDVSPLDKAENLEDLHLVDLPIADVPIAPGWSSAMSELHVEGDPSVKSFSFISKLAALRVLHLNDTKLDSLAPIAKLTKLEVLEIEHTKVSDLGPLASVKSLREIIVDATMPVAKRDALKKSLPHVEIHARPKDVEVAHVIMLANGTCETVCTPGECLCDPKTVPCPESTDKAPPKP